MKNNASLKGLLVAVVAFMVAFGIYYLFLAKRNYYVIDNPTSGTFYFKINNGSEGIISAGQTVPVNLDKGKNSIKVFDQNKKLLYDSAFEVNKIRGLLNIAHQDYYINTQYYGYNLKKDSLLLELGKTMIDGKPYLGAPKRFNKLYTDDFYYNVDEDYDKLIKNIQKVESRSKIFRKQDFINYYKEYYKF
ncbi:MULTISPECIES: hypothetical protein [Chryseobacterium]|uniref:Uncharacterized protein n=1 Tax=Chryseobacterium camelliae TaxID=1265445 RepID=A0ABU0TF80_9FLAO|nr:MULTISPECIES: hypothetical protein [Chryseobacterium]MDT3406572.1 hypothetical protein [Pseudacidovorax intermedius]MDQ1095631.1 hypothetical protein [Chryseobacterium camelliae]MDQ1099567.1 hypothetical protein [Chryseobacterium sp. SORGH_AS_1048]MDR6086915.1 hypothetical protein [Chryseobacterium sp. SORGH_AS_0909]MDR6131288.1 hypothetical protein [Chryseobacterium sp. SORGH_AS_1175]